jgi:hypothetical protein
MPKTKKLIPMAISVLGEHVRKDELLRALWEVALFDTQILFPATHPKDIEMRTLDTILSVLDSHRAANGEMGLGAHLLADIRRRLGEPSDTE